MSTEKPQVLNSAYGFPREVMEEWYNKRGIKARVKEVFGSPEFLKWTSNKETKRRKNDLFKRLEGELRPNSIQRLFTNAEVDQMMKDWEDTYFTVEGIKELFMLTAFFQAVYQVATKDISRYKAMLMEWEDMDYEEIEKQIFDILVTDALKQKGITKQQQ
ncbi:MAG: hypothetical protein FWC79_04450 [Oscillospiraceae bacterium]|nr:hypothetical protein [Oscillospiraceae bacterium]